MKRPYFISDNLKALETVEQESLLDEVIARHPHLAPAGEGEPAPGWVIVGEHQLREIVRWGP